MIDNNTSFTESGIWSGLSFELAFCVSNNDDNLRLITRLWQHPDLHGVWSRNSEEPTENGRISTSDAALESLSTLYGKASLPNRRSCPCSSYTVDEDATGYLYFSIPVAALKGDFASDLWEGRWSNNGSKSSRLDSEVNGQRASEILVLHEWFAQIAQFCCEKVPFDSAVTGLVTEVEIDELDRIVEGAVPPLRGNGFVRIEGGVFKWYPPNVF